MDVTSESIPSLEGLTLTEARSVIFPQILRFATSVSLPEDVRNTVVMVYATNNSIFFLENRPISAEPISEEPLPASIASIEAIPIVKILGEGIDCSICMSNFEIDEEAKEMPCKHQFHSICIDKWLGINGSCPICRYKIPVDEQCEKKDDESGEDERGDESGEDERGDDGGSDMEEDRVMFIFRVDITPETTYITVSITEVHRHSDDMLIEVGDGDVSEVRNGNESEAGNGRDGDVSEARDGNVSEAEAGGGGDDYESETQDMIIDNNYFGYFP